MLHVDTHSVEFRVDGYTIMDLEVCDGVALINKLNPLGVAMLVEFNEPRQLLDACMKIHGVKLNECKWYAELMLSAGMMEWASYRPTAVTDEDGTWYPWRYHENQHNYDIAWA